MSVASTHNPVGRVRGGRGAISVDVIPFFTTHPYARHLWPARCRMFSMISNSPFQMVGCTSYRSPCSPPPATCRLLVARPELLLRFTSHRDAETGKTTRMFVMTGRDGARCHEQRPQGTRNGAQIVQDSVALMVMISLISPSLSVALCVARRSLSHVFGHCSCLIVWR